MVLRVGDRPPAQDMSHLGSEKCRSDKTRYFLRDDLSPAVTAGPPPEPTRRNRRIMARRIDEDELIEHFTLYPDEHDLLRDKSGVGRLGFSLLLKYLLWKGRFPRGRSELPEGSVEFVAKQVGVAVSEFGFYDWDGRQIKRHRVQLRGLLGFRECTVADAEKLTAWLAEHVCHSERRPDRVREQLLGHLRAERIEPPAPTRLARVIGSALRAAEQSMTLRISGRIPDAVATEMHALVAEVSNDPTDQTDGR